MALFKHNLTEHLPQASCNRKAERLCSSCMHECTPTCLHM